MSNTPNAKIERYKLQTVFHDDDTAVVHTTYKTDLSARKRRATVETRWAEKRVLGSGGFGCVILQEDAGGKCRAVKRMEKKEEVDCFMELKALIKVLDVRITKIFRNWRR